ncbi:Interferon a3 [Bagarius yarrelli]|uniref:Interferon a3 n=1 Tax=Bagarius yarrelli TaxID=175774 RepID=A0A556V5A3_BAGYA|nr:Interferon a3 [Bagarius yarrelli]
MELLKFVLLLAFVILGVCEAAALPSCIWTHFRLKTLNEKSAGLLQNMNEDLFLVSLETLNGVVTIFENNQTSVTWNTTKLRFFKSIVKRQVENLQKCVGEEPQTVTNKPADRSTDTLRSYFTKLEKQLKEKEFSSCAWEMVRTELQDVLEKFQAFINSKK